MKTRLALPIESANVPILSAEGDRKQGTPSDIGNRDWHAACSLHFVIERLNTLLRVELAMVAGYQKALRTMKKKAVADSDHIQLLASEHQRTVSALQGSVQARGGAPAVAADPWEGSDADALTAEGAPARLESREFVSALLEVERRGLAEYESSVASLDEDARELVELELIPRQQRHVAGLVAMLALLAA